MRRQNAAGLFLIGIGALILLDQINLIGGDFFLYALALGFFSLYVFNGGRKEYGNVGWLIPGTILFAIALYADLEYLMRGWGLEGSGFFLFLGVAFLAVYLIHTRATGNEWGDRHWPIFPAGGLLGFALFIKLVDELESGAVNYVISAVLILIGVFMFTRSKKAKAE